MIHFHRWVAMQWSLFPDSSQGECRKCFLCERFDVRHEGRWAMVDPAKRWMIRNLVLA